MSSVDSLRRQVQAIRAKVGMPGDPKHWTLILETDEDIPLHIQAQIGEKDMVYIRYYPAGFCGRAHPGDPEPSCGYCQCKNGDVQILYRSPAC